MKAGIGNGKIKDDTTLMESNFVVDPNFGTLKCQNEVYHEFDLGLH